MSSPETAFKAQRSDRPLKGSAGGPGARLRDRFPETRARRRRARFAILLPPPVRARPSLPKRPPPLASRSSRGALVGLPSFAMRSLAACAIARPAGAAGRPARAPSAAARFRAPAASSGDAWRGPRGYHARGSRARRARGSSSRDAASSAAPGGAGGDDDDDIAGSVERSAKLLDLVIQETIEQIFVEEAAEEVLPDDDDDSDPSSPSPASAASAVDKEAILRLSLIHI